ncbi:hypothetical protein Csa_015450 [Cucumis sativus]|nr:hypothetical protein Csa_015450 [Cucumis sativus]
MEQDSLNFQVNFLTKLFTSLVQEIPKDVSCGIYGFQDHQNNQCLMYKEVSVMGGYNAHNSGYTSSPSSPSQGTYLEELISGIAYSLDSFETDFEKNLAKLSEYTVSLTGSMRNDLAKLNEQTLSPTRAVNNDLETMKASISEIENKLDQLATNIHETEENDELFAHAYENDVTLESRKIFNDKDDVNPSSDHVSLSAFDTLESLETLEKHGNFNEIVDQATLEHVEIEAAKNDPSDDDLSIFLGFVTSINDEHALVIMLKHMNNML